MSRILITGFDFIGGGTTRRTSPSYAALRWALTMAFVGFLVGGTVDMVARHFSGLNAGTQDITYTVVAGDSLSGIAQRYLGDAHAWPQLQAANPWLTDPTQLEVGDQLAIPSEGASE